MNLQGQDLEVLKEEVLRSLEGKSDYEKLELLILIGTCPDVESTDRAKRGMLRFSRIAAQAS